MHGGLRIPRRTACKCAQRPCELAILILILGPESDVMTRLIRALSGLDSSNGDDEKDLGTVLGVASTARRIHQKVSTEAPVDGLQCWRYGLDYILSNLTQDPLALFPEV